MTREFASKGALSSAADTSAFVDYIRSSLEIASLSSDDSTDALGPAVTVTTIHKSKGLEWSVVFAPDWTESAPFNDEGPIPASLLHDNASHQEEYDKACLAYVVLTRARDRLIISRSQELNRAPNPLFDQVVAELSSKNLVEKVKWPFQSPLPPKAAIQNEPQILSKAISFSLLSQMLHCGQSAKYEAVYGLKVESSGYLLALKAIRTTLRWISEKGAEGTLPSETEVEIFMENFWEKESPGSRQISGFYRPFALERVLAVLHRQTELGQIKWHQPYIISLPNGQEVAYHVDEVEIPIDSDPIVRLHRWHSQSPTEAQGLQLALYSHLRFEGVKPQIFLHNAVENSDIPVELSDYECRRRVRRIEVLVERLLQGDFQLRKGRHCNYCPYLLICPS